jgi:MFS superfamily sulfate permease-like transporter
MDFIKKSLLFVLGLIVFAFMVGVGFTLLAAIIFGVIIARIIWHWRIKKMQKNTQDQASNQTGRAYTPHQKKSQTVIIDAEYEVIDENGKDKKNKGN